MKSKGFSLIELICVAVILSVLGSILMPVFARAKLGSKAESAKGNLRGFWKAMMIYQSNYDEKVPFGLPEDMGLPSAPQHFNSFLEDFTGDHHQTWDTKSKYLPCGKNVGDLDFDGLGYMPFVKGDWEYQVSNLKVNTVLLYDKNCNVPGTRVMCQFCDKRSIGITLGGAIRDKTNSDWKVYSQHFYQ
jgi:prepilin-type N-terminal cleavage/methylation domain-containing protein